MTRELFFGLTLIAVMLFIGMEATLPPNVIFHAQNVLAMTLGIMVVVAFWPGLRKMLTTRGPLEPGHIMILGVCTNWLGMLLRQLSYYVVWDPIQIGLWYIAFPLWSFGLWLTLLGGVVHLLALRRPGYSLFGVGNLPGAIFVGTGIGIALGVSWLSALLIAEKPLVPQTRLCLPPINYGLGF